MPTIQQLPAASALAGSETMPIAQGPVTAQTSIAAALALLGGTSPTVPVDFSGQKVLPTGASTAVALAAFGGNVYDLDWFGGSAASADNSTALANAVAYLNSIGGGAIRISGLRKFANSTAIDIGAGITLIGSNPYSCALEFTNATTQGIYFNGAGSSSIGVGYQAASGVTMTGGQFVTLAGANNVFTDFQFTGDWTGLVDTGPASKIARGTLNAGVSGGVRILINTGDGSPTISDMLANAQSGTQPAAGIRLANAVACTITRVSMLNQGYGLDISPTGTAKVLSVRVSDCFFDSGSTGVNISPTTGGAVERIHMTNCWTGDSTGNGISIVNDGQSSISGITLIDPQSSVNTSSGIYTAGAVPDLTIIGGTFSQNSYGIYLNHQGEVTIIGTKAGAYGGMSGNTNYGISISTAPTSISINNVSVQGNTAGGIQNNNTAAEPNFISNVDEPGYATNGTITIGASPYTYTAPFDQTVYIAGTITNVVVNGLDIFNNVTNATVGLRRGQTVQVVYTGTPSMFYSA